MPNATFPSLSIQSDSTVPNSFSQKLSRENISIHFREEPPRMREPSSINFTISARSRRGRFRSHPLPLKIEEDLSFRIGRARSNVR